MFCFCDVPASLWLWYGTHTGELRMESRMSPSSCQKENFPLGCGTIVSQCPSAVKGNCVIKRDLWHHRHYQGTAQPPLPSTWLHPLIQKSADTRVYTRAVGKHPAMYVTILVTLTMAGFFWTVLVHPCEHCPHGETVGEGWCNWIYYTSWSLSYFIHLFHLSLLHH